MQLFIAIAVVAVALELVVAQNNAVLTAGTDSKDPVVAPPPSDSKVPITTTASKDAAGGSKKVTTLAPVSGGGTIGSWNFPPNIPLPPLRAPAELVMEIVHAINATREKIELWLKAHKGDQPPSLEDFKNFIEKCDLTAGERAKFEAAIRNAEKNKGNQDGHSSQEGRSGETPTPPYPLPPHLLPPPPPPVPDAKPAAHADPKPPEPTPKPHRRAIADVVDPAPKEPTSSNRKGIAHRPLERQEYPPPPPLEQQQYPPPPPLEQQQYPPPPPPAVPSSSSAEGSAEPLPKPPGADDIHAASSKKRNAKPQLAQKVNKAPTGPVAAGGDTAAHAGKNKDKLPELNKKIKNTKGKGK